MLRAALGDAPPLRVIATSRPGYLGTPLSSGATPEQQADLTAALLDQLGIASSFVIAVSAGGPSALHFALRHPSRCLGLILVSTCSGHLDVPPEVASRMPMMKLLARLPFLTALMRWRTERNPAGAAARAIRDEAVLRRTLAHPQAGPLLRALQVSALDRLSARLPGTLNDMQQFDRIAPIAFADITAPILVVHGTADHVVPFAHAQRVAEQAQNARLVAIDDGEHVSLFTHLDQVRIAVGEFVAAHYQVA